MSIAAFNDRVALWAVNTVGTMGCAYVFAVLALLALPSAIDDSFGQSKVSLLPLVTWVSQSFLQLVLLSVIMAGQALQSGKAEEQHVALRDHHETLHLMLRQLHDQLGVVRHGG